MTRGVCYMLVGAKHGPMLVVSVYTLRQWYDGPVALIAGDDAAEEVARLIHDDPRSGDTQVVRWNAPKGGGKGLQHCNKTEITTFAPFDEFVFLDADTMITGDITDLFPRPAEEVVLSQFANWHSTDRKIRNRTEPWREHAPEVVARSQAEAHPAINTGTFGLTKQSTDYTREWRRLSKARPSFMCDEIVAQLIHPDFDSRVVDERWNCVVGDTLVAGEAKAASRSFYAGEMTEVITHSGRRLTCTPNHPILTSRGFVAACELEYTDQLVAHKGEVNTAIFGMANGYHVQDRPTPIQEVFETFASRTHAHAARREFRRATPFDFHGDGGSVEGDVEIIRSSGLLLDDPIASDPQECCDAIFCGRRGEAAKTSRLGPELLSAFAVAGPSTSLLGRRGRYSPLVASGVCPTLLGGFTPAPDGNTASAEQPRENKVGTSRLLRERLQALASEITLDQVFYVRDIRSWSGHVYDLQTRDRAVIANGIYVSNCSPIYSWPRYAPPGDADVRIWHGHGWKFISRIQGNTLWMAPYKAAVARGFAKLDQWTPGNDRRLRKVLENGGTKRRS